MLVGSFNLEKALVGAFSVIVQLHRLDNRFAALETVHRVRTPSHLAVYPALTPVAVLLPEGGGVVDAEVVVRHHAVPATGARPRPAAAAALATRHLRGGGPRPQPRPLLLLGRVSVWRAGPDYGRAVCVFPAPALLGYKLRLGLGQFLVRIFCQQSAT